MIWIVSGACLMIGLILGVIIGRGRSMGTLKATADEDGHPYLFLEMAQDNADKIIRSKSVRFRVALRKEARK